MYRFAPARPSQTTPTPSVQITYNETGGRKKETRGWSRHIEVYGRGRVGWGGFYKGSSRRLGGRRRPTRAAHWHPARRPLPGRDFKRLVKEEVKPGVASQSGPGPGAARPGERRLPVQCGPGHSVRSDPASLPARPGPGSPQASGPGRLRNFGPRLAAAAD
eukprot:135563-Hanusia_phi.AAC.5